MVLFIYTAVRVQRQQRHPTPVLLPGKCHGWRSLVGCSPWGRWESDAIERLHFHFQALEKEMATHSSVLAWKIPGRGSLVGCCLWGRRVGHDWSDLAAAAAVRVKTQILGFPSSSFLCQVTMLGTMMGLICVGLEDSQILTSPAIPLHVVLKGNVLVTDKAKLQH